MPNFPKLEFSISIVLVYAKISIFKVLISYIKKNGEFNYSNRHMNNTPCNRYFKDIAKALNPLKKRKHLNV